MGFRPGLDGQLGLLACHSFISQLCVVVSLVSYDHEVFLETQLEMRPQTTDGRWKVCFWAEQVNGEQSGCSLPLSPSLSLLLRFLSDP